MADDSQTAAREVQPLELLDPRQRLGFTDSALEAYCSFETAAKTSLVARGKLNRLNRMLARITPEGDPETALTGAFRQFSRTEGGGLRVVWILTEGFATVISIVDVPARPVDIQYQQQMLDALVATGLLGEDADVVRRLLNTESNSSVN